MWTPKRIIMLSGCFGAFFVAYLGYACTALGRMDGLPPLPEAYFPNPDPTIVSTQDKNPETPLTRKIKLAFGPKCEELNRPIRLDLASKSMVLCAEQFEVTKDGKVNLVKLSLAIFGKDRTAVQPVEINTISGESALLTFDRPVSSFSEISSRKIVEAEIRDKIEIRNNRRRIERDQDLHVRIPNGPLFYRDDKHLVWTHDIVFLDDYKSKPQPNKVTGKDMVMELRTESTEGPKHGAHKGGKESITGVKSIEYRSDVQIDLWTEGKGGLVSNGPQAQSTTKIPATSAKPAGAKLPATKGASAKSAVAKTENGPDTEKAHVNIKTPGTFRYEIYQDHDVAHFDIPKPKEGERPVSPQQVVVIRTLGLKHDQLICHHLTLRLRRKDDNSGEKPPVSEHKASGNDNKGEEGAEIETIHATGPQGVVTLTSDAEKLDAHCADLFHDAVKGLTDLKDPQEVIVHKEDNDIYAKELHIQEVKPPSVPGQPEPKPYQNISAKGPGHIRMLSKEKEGTPPAPSSKPGQAKGPTVQHAYWQDLLTFSKDNGDDLLVLTGKARFIDEQAEQSLQADILKVWLEDEDKSQSSPATAGKSTRGNPVPAAAGKSGTDKPPVAGPAIASGRKPKHIEAIGDVTARSHEANIHNTGRLVAWFKDVPPEMHLPPATAPVPPGSAPARAPVADKRPAASPIPGSSGARHHDKAEEVPPRKAQPLPRGPQAQPTSKSGEKPAAGPELPPANTGPPPPRPFDLTARSVEAKILRSEIKSTIDELWCEGNVVVKQDPPTAAEKGTDVKGETLKMTARGADLYFLVVTGDLADLQTDKIRILGPEVNIDQSTNKAWVYGKGAMTMDSATNFQGDKLDKPVPLTVQWDKSMLFNGTSAEYHGNIEATQDKARLACQRMHVFFDRTISLKEGNKSEEPAKVRELVADRDVRVDESVYEGDVLKSVRKLRCPGLQMISLQPDDEIPSPGAGTPRPSSSTQGGSATTTSGAKTSEGNILHNSGPGSVSIWKHGDNEFTGSTTPPGKPAGSAPGNTNTTKSAAGAGKPAAGKAHTGQTAPGKGGHGKDTESSEMKLTYVEFGSRMDADSKKNMARFWGGARVLDLPCKDPEMVINLDAMLTTTLPEKAIYLRCDRLQVLDHPTDGKPNKQMEAHDRVYIQGREFYARSDSATYNEQKEQIILYGGDGYALLYKVDAPGGKPSVLEAKKIIYIRSTGVTTAFGVRESSGDSAPKSTAPAPATTRPGTTPQGMSPR